MTLGHSLKIIFSFNVYNSSEYQCLLCNYSFIQLTSSSYQFVYTTRRSGNFFMILVYLYFDKILQYTDLIVYIIHLKLILFKYHVEILSSYLEETTVHLRHWENSVNSI
jgi:hypothetical protein